MFRNLEAELKRNSITRKDVAKTIGVQPGTVSVKMHNRNGFSLQEALSIKNMLKVDLPIEYLFATADDQRIGG